MRVLMLEDRHEIMDAFTELLGGLGHEVCPCCDVYEADERLQEQEQGFDCYIVDLAMSTDGLGAEFVSDAHRGYFTGWVWLRTRVLSGHPEYAKRCILCSGYIDAFKGEYLSTDKDAKKLLCEVLLLSKQEIGEINKSEKLKKRLADIEKSI